jgi:hypothetical protein
VPHLPHERGVPEQLGPASSAAPLEAKTESFLFSFSGTAMRTLRALPIGGPHQHFAVPPAVITMEFVDRHEGIKAQFQSGINPALAGQRIKVKWRWKWLRCGHSVRVKRTVCMADAMMIRTGR